MKKQMSKLLTLFLLFCAGFSFGQERSVSGNVTTPEGEPLIGAIIKVPGTTIGTVTDYNGDFTIAVPEGKQVEISYVGYLNQSISADSDLSSIILKEDAFGLDEVVVTGVGVGTETKKLGFVVEKVGGKDLEEVPAANPANALRAKAPGITIVQPSGNPSSAASIRLRGATSINGSAAPLIIVDGIITNGDLRDINMEDVESIEVVKGAAAASLYGSQAGNGVIQIITKSGRVSKPTFTFRQEIGSTDLANDLATATRHPYQVDANNNFVLDDNGVRVLDPDNLFDNEYPQLFDNNDSFIKSQLFSTTYGSFSNNTDKSQFHVSAQKSENQGVINGLDPYVRNNFRANFTSFPTDKLTVKVNGMYADSEGVDVQEQGQGQFNYFYSAVNIEPFINIDQKDENGNYIPNPDGFSVLGGSNFANPLYVANAREFGFNRDRILARLEATYDITDNLSARAAQGIDYDVQNSEDYVAKGFIDPNPSSTLPLGSLELSRTRETFLTREFDLRYTTDLTDKLGLSAVARYYSEDNKVNYDEFSAFDFSAPIKAIEYAKKENIDAKNEATDMRGAAYIGDVTLDFDDKLIFQGLYRHEAFSQNGDNEKWNPYGRLALSYIASEDFDSDVVSFLKLRGSYGTAGNRPAYDYIYFNSTPTSGGGVEPTTSGNPDLKPSTIKDTEFGVTLGLLNKYQLQASYVDSKTFNDFLFQKYSPTSGSVFTGQWQNVGEINSTGIEVGISGTPLKSTSPLDWNFNLSFDKENSKIKDLGIIAPFTRGTASSAFPLFRFEEGVRLGTMYGNQLATSVSDLTLDDNGDVIGSPNYAYGSTSNLKPNNFVVNSDGYVIVDGTEFTDDEKPMYILNDEGAKVTKEIGNTIPDFKVGLSNTFTFKNFSLFGVVDWKQGGDIYNFTKQNAYFNDRHIDRQNYALAGHKNSYSDASSSLYNLSNPTSHFVEDGSYVKIRELALGYTMDQEILDGMGLGKLEQVKFNISGRNLFTFTNYSGWDPEVSIGGNNSTYFIMDEFSYPNFRTFSGTVQVKF